VGPRGVSEYCWCQGCMDLLVVGTGAAVGGMLRHAISTSPHITARPSGKLWSIAAINIAGSAALAGVACAAPLHPRGRLLLGTGMCGGFTTFSTFAVDVVGLVETQRFATAGAYVALNNIGSLVGAAGAVLLLRRCGGSAALPSPLAHSRSHELSASVAKTRHSQ
jgi:CrcB protein